MRRISLLSILVSFAIARVAPAAEKKLAFNRDIRPILSENCFECHGFDAKARQADLRLDQADSAYAKKEDGAIPIVPGHPEKSELWRRITSTDESEMMPPPDSHHKLKPAQKEILRRWIEQGAPFQKHWAFIPPVKAELPHVSDQSWPRDEIDNFILARIDAAGLKHAPEADRRTLIRRVSLDLTGLPPSANDVEDFAHNDDPHTYEKLVDRLLASPHYGERMALVWLDAARYADTNGFSIDGGRHMWLWRDWVINAFNTNMPYDEFLREQLAGDLLSHRTEAQLVATGFERNNMNTHEGGTIPEENLTNYNVDRVKTLGEAVLGLTLGCAQCHDHKFDPITQRDFYRLYAYFNTLSDVGLDGDRGINSRPSIRAHTVLHTGEEPTLRRQIADLKRKLANPSPADVAQWERKQREQLNRRGTNFQLLPVNLLKVSTPNIGKGYGIDPPNFVHVNIPSGLLAYDVSMRLPKTDKPITGLRIIFHPNAQGARGFGTLPRRGLSPFAESSEQMGTGTARRVVPLSDAPAKPTFVLTSFSASAESVPGDQVNLNRLRDVRHVTADSWLENYRPENVLDTRNFNGWSPDPTTTGPVRITVTFAQPIDAADTPFLTAKLNFGYGDNLIPTRFEILATTGTDNDSDLPPKIINILEQQARASSPPTVATDRPARTNQVAPRASQLVTLNAYFAAHADATRRDRIALANLEERLAVLTKKFPTMVMDVSSHPRETHILRRGDYSQPMEKVSPGTPAVLPPLPPGAPDSRLALANWVTMRGNPLTARVEVNRLWQIFFGTGIVATPADFGAQGAYPTHPELLDWLAVDFMDHNWDIKRLAKKIVMSATYRQASARRLSPFAESRGLSPFAESSEQKGTVPLPDPLPDPDPQNRLLSRGPRFRLPAEFIRDGALAISGLLVDRLGGPSVNPYTPGDLWREVSHYGSTPATAQTFVQDHGEKLYRRSLYTFWKRTVPPPNMVAFDAPSRETCTVYRAPTTTPLQALVMLNDVQFVEASRAFAERIIAHSKDETENLRWAFEECTSRPPTSAELSVLTSALQRERARYNANPAAAQEYLANGESLRNTNIPAPEHAAWSQVAALLLNLSETITRN